MAPTVSWVAVPQQNPMPTQSGKLLWLIMLMKFKWE